MFPLIRFLLFLAFFSPLEARASNFIVTNSNDSGSGSLRAAITEANANNEADTISFANSLQNETITLTSNELRITSEINLLGFENSTLLISGNSQRQVFDLTNSATVLIRNLTIRDGFSNSSGSGISNSGTLTLTNCTLSNHQGGPGAALFNAGGSLTLNDCLIEDNISDDDAAVNSNGSGPNRINRCRFVGNRSDRNGGAFASFGPFTISNSTFENNWAGLNGAALINANTLDLINCTFLDNQAVISGGAIDNRGNLNAINCTFSNNSAASGAAIAARFGINLINCTLANNNASGVSNISSLSLSEIVNGFNGAESFVNDNNLAAIETTGGLLTLAAGNFNIANTIFSNNTPQDIFAQNSTTIILNSTNLSSDNSFANLPNLINSNNLIPNTNPLLQPLANNGGPVLTFALLPTSPAIDAGSNNIINSAPLSIPTDARGVDRILTGLSSQIVDLGAFEFTTQTFAPPVCLDIEFNNNNRAVLTIEGTPGTNYRLLSSQNLLFDNASILQTLTLDTNGQATFIDPINPLPTQIFYQLQLLSPDS